MELDSLNDGFQVSRSDTPRNKTLEWYFVFFAIQDM